MNKKTLSKKEKVRKYGEVFTPQWVVEKMCDALEEESGAFDDIDKTFLEPSCGDGVFILEILKRKFKLCKKKSDYIRAIESVYGFEIQDDNVDKCINNVIDFCKKYFNPNKNDIQVIKEHIILCDSLKVMKLLSKDVKFIRLFDTKSVMKESENNNELGK